MLKGLWGVHTHRYDTDDSTGPEQRMDPLQQKDNVRILLRFDSLTAMSFKQNKHSYTQNLKYQHELHYYSSSDRDINYSIIVISQVLFKDLFLLVVLGR